MSRRYNALIVDDEPIAREILELHLAKIDSIEVIASCKNAMEAFKIVNNKSIDIVFLDINMPDISGLSFARSMNQLTKIIFTTAYREYAVDGFDLQAVDYILKPITLERLLQAVNKYIAENPDSDTLKASSDPISNSFLIIKSDRKMVKVDLSDITYVESLSDYVRIHRDSDTVVTRETISNIESKLPPNKFVRTHRSFIVALSKIDSYTHELITIGDIAVPISRTQKANVLETLKSVTL